MSYFIGPFFAKPQGSNIINKIKYNPTFEVFNQIFNLFDKIKPNTKIRGAMYMWGNFCPEEWMESKVTPQTITDKFITKAKNTDSSLIIDSYSYKHHSECINSIKYAIGKDNVIIDPRTGANDPDDRDKYQELMKWYKHHWKQPVRPHRIMKNERKKYDELKKLKAMVAEGYMHDKFFAFSELEDIGKNIVLLGSANFNYTQYYQYNDIIIVKNDELLFEKFLQHWDNIRLFTRDRKLRAKSNRVILKKLAKINEAMDFQTNSGEVYFFPRKKCPVLKFLKSLEADKNTSIDIAMSFFTRNTILETLKEIFQTGASIRVILGKEFANEDSRKFFKKYKIPFVVIQNDEWRGRMHHKFMIVRNNKLFTTWVGTYNFTWPALRNNDETVIKIEDEMIYEKYKDAFDYIWKKHSKKYINPSLL